MSSQWIWEVAAKCVEDNNTKIAAILLSAHSDGPNIKRISKDLGIPRDYITSIAKIAKENSFWTKIDGFKGSDEIQRLSLLLEVMVVLGLATIPKRIKI